MSFDCSQILVRVSDLALAREFYVEKLGLGVIEEYPKMFAVRAGSVRFSVFGGGTPRNVFDNDPPASIMLRTNDLDSSMAELNAKGVKFEGEVQTAPGFMRYVGLLDPDGNELHLAQYVGDPLVKA